MTVEQMVRRQRAWKEFTDTPIGAAFQRYERHREEAHRLDARVEYLDMGFNSAKEAWKRSDESRIAFLRLLGFSDEEEKIEEREELKRRMAETKRQLESGELR
jgi:hypothetical protein